MKVIQKNTYLKTIHITSNTNNDIAVNSAVKISIQTNNTT